MVGDHCSRARTTTATVDWLPRLCHVWLQLHRQMVPGPLPLEADGRRKSYACRGGGGPFSRHFLVHSEAPSEALGPKPPPTENSPQKAWPGPSGVPRSQTVPRAGLTHPRHPRSRTPARPPSVPMPQSPWRRQTRLHTPCGAVEDAGQPRRLQEESHIKAGHSDPCRALPRDPWSIQALQGGASGWGWGRGAARKGSEA